MIPTTDWVYDIETYLDLFCVDFTHVESRTRYIFEVSDRIDQSQEMLWFLNARARDGHRLFGFNNLGFDWPVLQMAMIAGQFTALDMHRKGNAIIGAGFGPNRWDHDVPHWKRSVTQGDLFKIHHFDNVSRSTGLKKLELNMRAGRIVDLPYAPDQPTTSDQKDEIIAYMCHDVSETLRFYHASLDMIRFRDELAQKYPDMQDVLNFNDTKIGKKFFEMELERSGTPCYDKIDGRNRPRQTHRDSIAMRDVISPKVMFQHPEFIRVRDWLSEQVLSKDAIDKTLSDRSPTAMIDGDTLYILDSIDTKGVFKDVTATIDGFTYAFGTGGIHGSLTKTIVHEDDDYEIWDWDVASYYPNLAISNGFYPKHLSEQFVTTYKKVFDMRREYKKGTAENAMLKLALNGVYGDSNNKYGPFYDPQYTMSITVNGQLLLCVLAEWLTQLSGGHVTMIQINTDGMTLRVHKTAVDWMKSVCKHWEGHTGLELESVRYKSMFIRDVNSYIAVKMDGKVKRIGAYAHQTWFDDPYTRERQWHQNHSMLVVRKAAEAQMVHGIPIETFIKSHRDPFDFQLSVKVPRNMRLEANGERVQNTSRFYVSRGGVSLIKVMPPLKGKTEERRNAVQAGWTVTLTNDMKYFDWSNVNWLFYIEESRKLLI